MTHPTHAVPQEQALSMEEQGAPREGIPQKSQRRLYVQLQVYTHCPAPEPLIEALKSSGIESVLYLDVQDPQGVGILTLAEDPSLFVTKIRSVLSKDPFAGLRRRPELAMIGRTYSMGREQDLEDWLLQKPRRTAFNPQWPWAVWYPMRRKSTFELLPREEQGKILFEHARIGMTYGQADFAHDIRLACYGLDTHDNEFVVGLLGKDLHPLSRVVQDMRKTQQTANHMESLGPFFVGKALWQSPLPG
jgi:chlorite dismutase